MSMNRDLTIQQKTWRTLNKIPLHMLNMHNAHAIWQGWVSIPWSWPRECCWQISDFSFELHCKLIHITIMCCSKLTSWTAKVHEDSTHKHHNCLWIDLMTVLLGSRIVVLGHCSSWSSSRSWSVVLGHCSSWSSSRSWSLVLVHSSSWPPVLWCWFCVNPVLRFLSGLQLYHLNRFVR